MRGVRPSSLDLRERVAAAVDHQEGSQQQIARRFRVSPSFIIPQAAKSVRRGIGCSAPPHRCDARHSPVGLGGVRAWPGPSQSGRC